MTPTRHLILRVPIPRHFPHAHYEMFDAINRPRLEGLGEVIWLKHSPDLDAQIDRYLPDTIAVIGPTYLDKARLDRAPHLRAIVDVLGAFPHTIDYAECHRRGIHALSIAPAFAKPVAELSLALAMSSARRVHEADAAIRRGDETLYGANDNFDSILLSARTMSTVGCGNVGRALLNLLRPFGGKILAHDPWIHPHVLAELGVVPASLQECFEQSAVVFLLTGNTSENAGGIGAAHFASMQKGSIVVLTGRAGIVNFDELLDAAASGHIRAAIDVWPDEPIPADHRARHTPNTLLSAHRAGAIPEVWPLMGQFIIDDLEQIIRGLAPSRCQRAQLEFVAKYR